MQLGFVGLGNLGQAMARRYLDQGVRLTAWNRSPERARALDLPLAASPAALLDDVPAVVLCLASSDAVEVVLRGQDGLLAGDCADKLIIDTTTNHPAPVHLFHELCRQKGAQYVEAPVAGSVAPALAGKLVAMMSGTAEAVAAARPYLAPIAASIHELGGPGQATRMKLVNNLCLGTIMAVVGEALATAEAAGVDRDQALAVLGEGGGKSLVLDAKRQKLREEDWAPHFSAAMIHKDLHCLQDLARELKLPQHLAGVVKEQYARLLKDGRGDQDFAAIYDVFR
jgi:3-hydroxyisobutyrate dehydrogenase